MANASSSASDAKVIAPLSSSPSSTTACILVSNGCLSLQSLDHPGGSPDTSWQCVHVAEWPDLDFGIWLGTECSKAWCPEDPILKKINPDQSWSIILNLIFFNRKSCFFQSWGLILFSISARYQINILNQYQTNPKIDTWSISALLLCELAENHVLRCRLAVNSL